MSYLGKHARAVTILGVGLLALVAFAAAGAQQTRAKTSSLTPQDYIEIHNSSNKYAFALDSCSNNGDDYADLYTSDGIFEWGVGSRRSVGRESARRGGRRRQGWLQKARGRRHPKSRSRIT